MNTSVQPGFQFPCNKQKSANITYRFATDLFCAKHSIWNMKQLENESVSAYILSYNHSKSLFFEYHHLFLTSSKQTSHLNTVPSRLFLLQYATTNVGYRNTLFVVTSGPIIHYYFKSEL